MSLTYVYELPEDLPDENEADAECAYCGYPIPAGEKYCSRGCAQADIEDDRRNIED